MNYRRWIALIGMIGLLTATGMAKADDGGLSFGGTPRLLSGHPSVSMQSEVVRMTVGTESVKVECDFVFHNSGPACIVRMGFPDEGRGSEDPDEEGVDKTHAPQGTFTSYASYVDGVKVPTRVIRADKEGNFWHTKDVKFAAGATRRVRDVYTLRTGSQIAMTGTGAYSETYYILHTGASWHGPIGRAELDITFAPGTTSGALRLVPLNTVKGNDAEGFNWPHSAPGTVVYRGPCIPTVQGRTLRFVRTNFKPGYLDDVLLYFGYHRNGQ
jgi:hypothetical protein